MSKFLAHQLSTAIAIANTAHIGQTDRGGTPYILHCLWVMERQVTANRKVCAVLHDVIEDTTVTLDDLRKAGFSEPQLTTIDLLTRRKGETKMESIQRLIAAKDSSEGQDAIHIKIVDNHHNSMLERLRSVTDDDLARRKIYGEIQVLLKEACTFDGFLDGQNLENQRF